MKADDRVLVQEADFNVAKEYQRLIGDSSCGAVVIFTGLVRDLPDAQLHGMHLEHYPAMTQRALESIVGQARERWELGAVTVIHRVGKLALNEQIVFTGVSSAHRKNAYEASMFIMDYLKMQAPFWKKEITGQGEYWVEAKQSDKAAQRAWNQEPVKQDSLKQKAETDDA